MAVAPVAEAVIHVEIPVIPGEVVIPALTAILVMEIQVVE